jgi:phospholipid/cholesterol/gamma-HCH transport system substrate-binding protein
LIGLSLFLVLTIVVTWMVYVTLKRDVSGSTNTYTATFSDVMGLKEGDDVRVAGVRVGRVDRIDLVDTVAEVTFRVENDHALYTDTIASVVYQNIIGQRYIGLSPGQRPNRTLLPENGAIPLESTEPSFDITYLLRGFEPLFALLDPEQVDNLTDAIIEALQGDDSSILSIITQTSALAEVFAGPDQVLGNVVTNLNSAVSNLAGQSGNLQTVITQTRDIMVALDNRREALRDSVGSINSAVGRLADITGSVYPEFSEMVDREPGLTTHLAGEGHNRIAFFGANLPATLKGIARFTQEGAYGNIYGCDATSHLFAFLSRLVPDIVRHATPGNTIKHSPVCR